MPEELFIDQPIKSEKDDLLGRTEFARALAKTIAAWRGEEALIIALSGDWGSGKTSLKNMTLEALRRHGDRAPEFVEFNPWKWSSQHKVSEAFFREISIALGKADKSKGGQARVARWNLYGQLLTFGSETLSDFSDLIPILLSVAAFFGVTAYFTRDHTLGDVQALISLVTLGAAALLKFGGKLLGRLAQFMRENAEVASMVSLEDRKEDLKNDLARLKRCILVVIDDIDRVNKEETRILFQHIKTNADFPKLVYLMLYQKEIVEASLSDPPLRGKEYLEKIVQLPFDIPAVAQVQITKVLFAGLDKVLARLSGIEVKFDKKRWGNVFLGALQAFFDNLRSVNRFLSTFSVHVELFRGGTHFEVNPIDLIALETLRVFEPEVYRRISRSKSLLTAGSLGGGREDQVRSEIQSIVEIAPVAHREQVREIIKQLFPPIEWVFGGSRYDDDWRGRWREELRVCSADVFDRFFQLRIPEGDLSESEFRDLVEATANREQFRTKIESLKRRDLLDAALSRLDDYKEKIPFANALEFVPALFDIGDDIADDIGFTGIGGHRHLVRIVIWYLRQDADPKNRGHIICEAITLSEGLTVGATVISLDIAARAKDKPDVTSFVMDDEHFAMAKDLWLGKITKFAESNSEKLVSNKHFASVLYRWRECGGEVEPSKWVASLIESDAGLLAFLTGMTQYVTTQTLGDYVGERKAMMRIQSVEDFVSVDRVKQRVDSLDPKNLSETHKRAIAAFRAAVKRREQGKGDFSTFDLDEI